MKGIVVKYDAKKGFGFIRSNQYEKNLFVHISSVQNAKFLTAGQVVDFEVEDTSKGLAAVSVVVGRKQSSPFLIFGVVSVVLMALITAYFSQTMNVLLAYFIAINLTTFILYGYDKVIAGSGRLRIPEWVLHSLAIAGGSPAALVAQKMFRHKTLKGPFQLIYWVIVVLQAASIWLITKV